MPKPEIRSIEAERAVIGACLLDEEALPVALEIVRPDDFDAHAHRQILTAIIKLRDPGNLQTLFLLQTSLRPMTL